MAVGTRVSASPTPRGTRLGAAPALHAVCLGVSRRLRCTLPPPPQRDMRVAHPRDTYSSIFNPGAHPAYSAPARVERTRACSRPARPSRTPGGPRPCRAKCQKAPLNHTCGPARHHVPSHRRKSGQDSQGQHVALIALTTPRHLNLVSELVNPSPGATSASAPDTAARRVL